MSDEIPVKDHRKDSWWNEDVKTWKGVLILAGIAIAGGLVIWWLG